VSLLGPGDLRVKSAGQCVNFLAESVYRPIAGGVSTIDNSKQISTNNASPPAIIMRASPSCD
jgi:hypothetical protein